MELLFMLKKCSFKFLPPRNWNQRIWHVVTLEQGLKDLASAQSVHVRGHEEKDPLTLDHLVEFLAEIGHEHGHGGGIARTRAGTESPETVKTPAKSGLFRLAQGQTSDPRLPDFSPF